MKNQLENPNGLHQRYAISKIQLVKAKPLKAQGGVDYSKRQQEFKVKLVPVDEKAEYFVLRLDDGGSDINHITACRFAIHTYADIIEMSIPKLAADLRERYPLPFDKSQRFNNADEPLYVKRGLPQTVGELRKMLSEFSDDAGFGFVNQPAQELYAFESDGYKAAVFQ